MQLYVFSLFISFINTFQVYICMSHFDLHAIQFELFVVYIFCSFFFFLSHLILFHFISISFLTRQTLRLTSFDLLKWCPRSRKEKWKHNSTETNYKNEWLDLYIQRPIFLKSPNFMNLYTISKLTWLNLFSKTLFLMYTIFFAT